MSFVPGGDSREFLFQMADPTQGWTWSLDQTMEYVTPACATAEWIMEGPSAELWRDHLYGSLGDSELREWSRQPTAKTAVRSNTTYQDGEPRTTTSNPPVIASSLGYNEPASGHQSSRFTILYSSDTDSSDNVAAAQQPASVVNAASVGLAALDSAEKVEPQSPIARVASGSPRSEATAVTLTGRSASDRVVSPIAGLFTRPRAFRGQRVATLSPTWRATLN